MDETNIKKCMECDKQSSGFECLTENEILEKLRRVGDKSESQNQENGKFGNDRTSYDIAFVQKVSGGSTPIVTK